MKRGFITLAIGEHYCTLAENLLMSYRLFSDGSIPFHVITDKVGAARLSHLFDGVVVLDQFFGTFLDKIYIYNNTSFDETIFIDADANIVDDISDLFNDFEQNGSDVSAIANIAELNDKEAGHLFGKQSVRAFNLKYDFPHFNGGVYYFKKSETADACAEVWYEAHCYQQGLYAPCA